MASVASHASISDNLPRKADGTLRAETPSALLADIAHALFLAHGLELDGASSSSPMAGRTFVHPHLGTRLLFHPINFGDHLILHVRCGDSPTLLKLSLSPHRFVLLAGQTPPHGQVLFQPLGPLFNVRFDEAACRIETHLVFAALPSLRPPAHVANPFVDLPTPLMQYVLEFLTAAALKAAAGSHQAGLAECREQWRSRPARLRRLPEPQRFPLAPDGFNGGYAGFDVLRMPFPYPLGPIGFDPFQPRVPDGLYDDVWGLTPGSRRHAPAFPGVGLSPDPHSESRPYFVGMGPFGFRPNFYEH